MEPHWKLCAGKFRSRKGEDVSFVSPWAISRWTGSVENLRLRSRCPAQLGGVARVARCHPLLPSSSRLNMLDTAAMRTEFFDAWEDGPRESDAELRFEVENDGGGSDYAGGGSVARAEGLGGEDALQVEGDVDSGIKSDGVEYGEIQGVDNVVDEDGDVDDVDGDEIRNVDEEEEDEDEDEEDDDDDDDDDDAEKDDDEDEDEDLASYEIETDDDDDIATGSRRRNFDEDGLPIMSSRGPRSSGSAKGDLGIGGVDADEDDDVVDFEENPEEVLDVSNDTPTDDDADADSLLGELGVEEDEDDEAEEELRDMAPKLADEEDEEGEDRALFDSDNEAELRSAAKTMEGTSLLGLGVDGAARTDSTDLAAFALESDGEAKNEAGQVSADVPEGAPGGPPAKGGRLPQPSAALGDFSELVKRAEETTVIEESEDLEMGAEEGAEGEEDEVDEFIDPALEEDSLQGPKNLDSYKDNDEHDDELMDFGVTTSTNFGRIWELNDDAYVTISEAGEAYAYDIDESESDDQDSAVMRRGSAAGWGGSLQADARSSLPVGSKEWIARRAYDLVAKASPSEMFKWTRARKSPPDDISTLFPPEPPAPTQFPVTVLDSVVPGPDGDDSSTWLDDENAESISGQVATAEVDYEPAEGQNALERSVDFPCMYKFKLVGSGPDFVASLTRDMEAVLGRKVPSNAFEFEPAGRYQRVVISVEVENARQVTELYEAVGCADGVKFSYGY